MPFDPTKPRSRDEVLLQAIVSGDSSAMGDPRDREEEFVKAIADKETLPDYSEASNGDVLQIGTGGPEWGAVPNELPAIAAGDAGKVLKVNSGETGTEWGAVPNELPAIAAGDAGKVLKVNESETGAEWASGGSNELYIHIASFYKATTNGRMIGSIVYYSSIENDSLTNFLSREGYTSSDKRYYNVYGIAGDNSDAVPRSVYVSGYIYIDKLTVSGAGNGGSYTYPNWNFVERHYKII